MLHHFNYKFKDSDESITVATTRIETMLGDTAVAIHKDDGVERACLTLLPIIFSTAIHALRLCMFAE